MGGASCTIPYTRVSSFDWSDKEQFIEVVIGKEDCVVEGVQARTLAGRYQVQYCLAR